MKNKLLTALKLALLLAFGCKPASVPLEDSPTGSPPGTVLTLPKSSVQRTLASATVPVQLTARCEVQKDMRGIVAGMSNLPRGTELSVSITSTTKGEIPVQYFEKAVVDERGNYQSKPLGSDEIGMLPELMNVRVAVSSLNRQPPAVREHFANDDKALHGPLVITKGPHQRSVEVTVPLDLRVWDANLEPSVLRQQQVAYGRTYLEQLETLHTELQRLHRDPDTPQAAATPILRKLDKLYHDRKILSFPKYISKDCRQVVFELREMARLLEKGSFDDWKTLDELYTKRLAQAQAQLDQF